MSTQNSINAPLPLAVSQGGTGNSTALTNGQLWTGHTGNPPSISTLTGGSGINIDNTTTPGNIIIKSTQAMTVINIFDTSNHVLNPFNVYVAHNTGVSFTLPSSPTIGDYYYVTTTNVSGGFTISIPSGDFLYYQNNSTFGTSITTSAVSASISIMYVNTNQFKVLSTDGSTFTGS